MTIDSMPPTGIPPLPPGTDANNVGAWEQSGEITTRLCWSSPISLPDSASHLDIRAVVEQRPDGAIADTPLVYLADQGWSVHEARLVARALLQAAEAGERMAATTGTDGK